MDFIRKYIFVVLTALGALFLFLYFVFGGINPLSGVIDTSGSSVVGGDYRSYYFAAEHFMAGDNIYFSEKQNIKYPQEPEDRFVYPPLRAMLFIPMTFVPLMSSYVIFIVLSVVIFLLTIYFLSKELPNRRRFLLLSFIAFLASPILVLHFERGQTDIIILFLVVASFLALLKNKSILAGVFVGIATSLKITPLIFLPYFFIKDKKAFWSSVVTIVAVFTCFSGSVLIDFFQKIRDFSSGVSSGNLSNSMAGVLNNNFVSEYFPHSFLMPTYIGAITMILVATFFFVYKNKVIGKFTLLEYGIMSTFMMIIPSTSWAYNGVHSLILFAGYWSVRFNGSLSKWWYFFFDILVYISMSQPLLSPLLRDFPIHHIFSLRPLIYLCFVALFIYLIHKGEINEFIARLRLTRFYTSSFLRFCVVGFVGTVSNLLVFYLLSKVFNINIAAIGAFAFAVSQNYILNHSWSFKSKMSGNPNIKGYFRYVFVNLFGLVLNLLVLNLLVGLGFNALLAQAIGVVSGLLLNYAGSYLFVFARKVKINA